MEKVRVWQDKPEIFTEVVQSIVTSFVQLMLLPKFQATLAQSITTIIMARIKGNEMLKSSQTKLNM